MTYIKVILNKIWHVDHGWSLVESMCCSDEEGYQVVKSECKADCYKMNGLFGRTTFVTKNRIVWDPLCSRVYSLHSSTSSRTYYDSILRYGTIWYSYFYYYTFLLIPYSRKYAICMKFCSWILYNILLQLL